jgi:hypothetical protein
MQAFMAKSMPETTDCALSKEMGAGMAVPQQSANISQSFCRVRALKQPLLPWDKPIAAL